MSKPIDVTRPSVARIYDYLLGGNLNYAVDRQLAESFLSEWPELAVSARANRAWVRRVIRYLARDEGVDQFLDIGSGLPTADNVHQVAQRINPAARVLYVDNDPIVLAHGRALLAEDGQTDYAEVDAREVSAVLAHAERHLDASRPVGVLMSSVLHYISEPPAEIVSGYVEWLRPGSFVAITHVTSDGVETELARRLTEHYSTQTPRPIEEIRAAFAGLELVPPGMVDAPRWRPEGEIPTLVQPLIAGVGKVS
ncbi:SAM-dependent methyltransferase [Actinomadura nitritigenes]|uniref:SAM-dependent methyltransferase n=1 Tax=Actinomadura nitritigenes TaxID=134602 RepID=UPI003D93D15B